MQLPVSSLVKRFPWLLAALGFGLCVWLIAQQGWRDELGILRVGGWALLWIVPLHLLPLLLDATSWRLLLAPRDPEVRAGIACLWWVTSVREAVARLLPLASVGGELVGIRLTWLRGVSAPVVTASVVMQLMLSVVNQYLFAVLGALLMLWLSADVHLGRLVLLAMFLGSPLPFAAWMVLRHGRLFERAQRFLQRLSGDRLRGLPVSAGAKIDAELRSYGQRPLLLLTALSVEFVALSIGASENWLALRLLGHPVSPWAALALEAGIQVVRHLFFMVPASLGVQEGGLLILGGVFGMPADMSIALSLIKRMRELLLGVPALLSWQWLEFRRLHRGRMDGIPEQSPL